MPHRLSGHDVQHSFIFLSNLSTLKFLLHFLLRGYFSDQPIIASADTLWHLISFAFLSLSLSAPIVFGVDLMEGMAGSAHVQTDFPSLVVAIPEAKTDWQCKCWLSLGAYV